MEQTLEPDQYVLVDKLTPRFDAYKRGDIVVFNPPANWVQQQGQPYIKRVIGVGGDTVEIKDGAVYVNGTKLNEPYVFKDEDGNAPADRRSDRREQVGRARRRAVPDGRPPGELGRLAGVRAGQARRRDRPRLAPLLADQHVQDHRPPTHPELASPRPRERPAGPARD